MRCDSVISILPGYAGEELLPATAAAVRGHLGSCTSCRASLESLSRVSGGLASLAERELDPPPFLADSIIERIAEPRRRLIPVPPVPPGELVRVVTENRDAIASAAGAAIVVAGAAWLFWRTTERRRRIPAVSH